MEGKKKDWVVALKKAIKAKGDQNLDDVLNEGKGVCLPANLDIVLRSVNVDRVSVFTSATKPLLLPFYWRKRIDGKVNDFDEQGTFTMMFKTGDDMRQDALVLQLFSVMENCLA